MTKLPLLALAIAMSTPAEAAPRQVRLLNFAAAPAELPAPEPEADAAPEPSAEADAVGRALAAVYEPDPLPAPTSVPAIGGGAQALGNPFSLYSVARNRPFYASPAIDPTECAIPVYRPHGRLSAAAEARRRLLFPIVHRAACEQGLPVGLFDALIVQESRYQPLAISPKGAIGLAQLMPGTARQLGANPYDLYQNLRGGARYLRQQVDAFGRYDLALAAYNAGPGRVRRRWTVPAIAETQNYVSSIFAGWTGMPARPMQSAASPLPYRQAKLVFMAAAPTLN